MGKQHVSRELGYIHVIVRVYKEQETCLKYHEHDDDDDDDNDDDDNT